MAEGKKSTYDMLKEYRARTDLKLKPLRHLKSTFTDFSGQEKPLTVRYYQIQGIIHLVAMKRFLLGDDTGLGKCKPLSSMVWTDKGLMPLRAIAPSGTLTDEDTFYPVAQPIKVWTGWEWAPVSKFYYNGVKPTVTVKTRRGYETTGTLVHPLWVGGVTKGSFIKMGDFRVGDEVAVQEAQGEFQTDTIVSITYGEEAVADLAVDHPRHSFVADGFINHNTLETIGALCYLWETNPETKAIVLTTKSAAKQWVREFGKFTTGIKVILCHGSPAQRAEARKMYEQAKGPTVLVMGYRSAVQDFRAIQKWQKFILVTDEASTFKTPTTQVHQVVKYLASQADRIWALTATMIKNHLMEGFGIMQGVVTPGLFQIDGKPMSKNQFMLYFCITRMQSIPRCSRQIPVIVGYTPEKIREFREMLDPFFLGRPKHAVATELPAVVMQEVEVDMTPLQEEKYAEAMHGLLQMGEGDKAQEKETSKLTALIYHQEIANSPELIDIPGESPKLEALVELLTDGDFAEEKVIVYSRFKRFIDIIMARLKVEKVKAVRITGTENGDQRDKAMQAFQDPESDVRVCCLTAAGTESINLQAAKALICMDTPWSAGDFLQLLGRMIRIGSVHDRCYVIHMLARNRGGGPSATIDHKVMKTLKKKMTLIEAVLGKRLKGVEEEAMISSENEISNLFSELREEAKAGMPQRKGPSHRELPAKKVEKPPRVAVAVPEDDGDISDILDIIGSKKETK